MMTKGKGMRTVEMIGPNLSVTATIFCHRREELLLLFREERDL